MATLMTDPQITVDKSYFDALLRRADVHPSTPHLLARHDAVGVTISRPEYDSLLRDSREFQLLKNALFSGGITPDTLALLIAGTAQAAQKECNSTVNAWADDFDDSSPTILQPAPPPLHHYGTCSSIPWKSGVSVPTFSLAPGNAVCHNEARSPMQPMTHRTFNNASGPQRLASYGAHPSCYMEDACVDEADSLLDEGPDVEETDAKTGQILRTLYFTGFNSRTTYRDLCSVIKGGKLLSISMRSEKSATVTFLDAAADYLAWAKRNDVYLNGRRVEVRWAERQYKLNGHIQNKIDSGATRNLLIRNAVEKGFTETQIRDDMEHIHNLVVIEVRFIGGSAYVYTNSIPNALFARTCMMSRTTYRGCKISFFPDECDQPLPARAVAPKAMPMESASRKAPPLANRFDMLNLDGTSSVSGSSDEEHRTPEQSSLPDDEEEEDEDEEDAIGYTSRHGVSLHFLDSDSTT